MTVVTGLFVLFPPIWDLLKTRCSACACYQGKYNGCTGTLSMKATHLGSEKSTWPGQSTPRKKAENYNWAIQPDHALEKPVVPSASTNTNVSPSLPAASQIKAGETSKVPTVASAQLGNNSLSKEGMGAKLRLQWKSTRYILRYR